MDRTQLWQTHGGLCRKLARRYSWMLEADPALEYEDLVQTAFLGLVMAQETFDPAAGKRFAGWAAWFIARQLRRLLPLLPLQEYHMCPLPLLHQE